MKRRILLVIIVLIVSVLFSCVYKPPPDVNDLKSKNVFELSSTEIFFAKETYNDYDYAADRKVWTDLLEERFSVKIDITSLYELSTRHKLLSLTGENDVYRNIKKYIEDGTIRGLFIAGNEMYIEKLAEEGLILPLDKYLKENTVWNTMPDDYRNTFKINGHVYGIPSCSAFYTSVRYIRKDWLDKQSLSIPGTLMKYYEVMKNFTYNDPDENGLNDTAAMEYFKTGSMADIFAAFDVRLNHEGKLLPVWNPNTEIYEDSMRKPQMSECIDFLRSCHSGNLVKKHEDMGDVLFYKGSSGTYYTYQYACRSIYRELMGQIKDSSEVKLNFMIGMTHHIDKNICGYHTEYKWPYVLTVNTDNPHVTINTFMDAFIGNLDGYILGAYGPEGKGYTLHDLTVVTTTFRTGDISYSYRSPKILNNDPLDRIRTVCDSIYHADDIKTKLSDEAINKQQITECSLAYQIPLHALQKDYNQKLEKNIDEWENFTEKLVYNLIFSELDFKEALVEYDKQSKKTGIAEYITQQNSKGY